MLKYLWATIALLLTTTPAQADPVSVITFVGTTLGVSTAVATFIVAAVVVGTVALAAKAIQRKRQQRLQAQASIAGVLVTKTGASEPIPVVYGERRIAGSRIFVGSDGDKNKYLHVVEALCEGPIDACTEIYLADELAATSSDNGATWSIESKFQKDGSDLIQFKFFDGSQTAMISGTVLGRSPHSDWPSGAVGNDTAYVYIVAEFDQDVFGGGLPVITFKIRGKKLPAIGSNYNTTLTYSNEPARCIYDYLISPTYGKAIPYTLIDTTTFNAGATYNSQTVNKTASDSTQVTRYECNAYIDTGSSLLDNIEGLFTTCRGALITGDTYKFIQDKPLTPSSVNINDDNIVGNINFLQANKKSLFNHIRAKFPNEASDFNYQEDITVVESATLQNSSNDGLKLSKDIELPNVTDKDRVNRIITEELNASRQSGVLEVDVDPSMLDLSVGDVVKFTNSTLGQTNKLYRILKTVVKQDHIITINMKEYDANVYWDNNKTIITNNKDDTDH